MSKDPKQQAGEAKTPLQLLPTVALREEADVLKLGAEKYGKYNWRHSEGVVSSTYVGAILRHLTQYMDGEDADEESGKSHLAHIRAGCAILLDAEAFGTLIDDREKIEEKSAEAWEPPCIGTLDSVGCIHVKHPVVCGSCVKRPEGRTNFKARK